MSPDATGGGERRLAASAEPEALHRLTGAYHRHHGRVLAICLSVLRDPALAEDAAQETFVRAARHLHTVDEQRVAAYLAVVARNVCTDELRRRQRGGQRVDQLHAIEATLDPERLAIDRHLVAFVWSRLSRMDRAFFMYRLAGYSHDEIARRFHLSTGAARKGLMRARTRARRLLETVGSVCTAPWRMLRGARRTSRHGARGVWSGILPASTAGTVATALLAAAVVTAAVAAPGAGSASTARLAAIPLGAPVAVVAPDVEFVDLAAARGAVVLASGYRQRGCQPGHCAVLERSDDAGTTWRALPAAGFAGGDLLPPSAYPERPLLLADGPAGLQRSDDGGRSFVTVAGLAGPATLLDTGGGLAAGDSQILVAAGRPLLYDTRSDRVTTLSLRGWPSRIASLAASGPHQVLVATSAGGLGGPAAEVLRCDLRAGCSSVLTVPGGAPPRLFGGMGAVAAVTDTAAYLAPSPGAALRPLSAPPGAVMGGGTILRHGEALRLLLTIRSSGGSTLVSSSGNGWEPLAPTPALPTPGAIVAVARGRIVAAPAVPDTMGRWGLRCSGDGGRTWQPSC